MSQLRIGTCSWKYDSWRGIIYSDDPEINYLKEYSKHFNTVEIDQWFWSLHGVNKVTLPKPDVVKSYRISVPNDFKFTVKLPNSISLTHLYRANKNESLIPNPHFLSYDLLNEFISIIKSMKDNLGPLMFQFEYLNKDKMKSQFEFQGLMREFVKLLPPGYKFSLEIRNPNYLNEDYFQFIREHKLGHVFLQGYYMPSIFDIYKKYKDFIKDYVVIRLHGPDRHGIENRSGGEWNKILDPKDEEIGKVIEMIAELLERNVDIYLNVNNHYEGSAPLTIQKIQKLLKQI
ncbi:MAG: DUF72 domain-containing protein [Ignavibacteriae bacterium HGW-Ignavibacteriae-3]|nr:MAG: DUF72 domain-containing protein [Ignavibacteriae bacterium HGW-Ignavibacteriae-3]